MSRAARASVEVVDGAEQLAERAAVEVLSRLGTALAERAKASWVVSGGSTPRRLFQRLADRPGTLDWQRVSIYWADERCVPPEHSESNFGVARRELLDRLPISAESVHRIRGELPPAAAAEAYGSQVAVELERGPFDLVLLGLGADGHTASLFPGSLPEMVPGRLAVATTAPVAPRRRVSLTPAALSSARSMVFLVSGAAKAGAVAAALGPAPPTSAQGASVVELAQPDRTRVLWLLDRAAAAGLR